MAAAPEFPAWAVEEAARQLQITLRQLRQAQGTLYFCTLPSGLRFDLYAGLDGTLQCWRLVDGSGWEKDRRMECRDPSRNGPAVGVEPTGEGTLRIYAEQHIDPEEPDPEKKILKLLRGYVELISAPEMQHLGL